LTVVVDHDTGRLVWPRRGVTPPPCGAFDALGAERAAQITTISTATAAPVPAPG
jgi:hypothetical protein